MLETTKRVIEEMDELIGMAMSEMDVMEQIKNMNPDSLKAYQLSIKLIDSSKDLMVKQAEMIEEQDKKLDKILKLLEKKA